MVFNKNGSYQKSEFGKVEWVWFTKHDRIGRAVSLEDASTIYLNPLYAAGHDCGLLR